MSTSLWDNCHAELHVLNLIGEVHRVVESQRQIATNQIVDDLSEQAVLEELLEQTKPPLPTAARALHYLLSTPFRYPPLRHGSRFASRFEPGLFYGSRDLATALTETAYYRLRFWFDMSIPPPVGRLTSQHTAFTATINAERGVQLQHPPCGRFRAHISDPLSHRESRRLGTALRGNDILAFEYRSARDSADGLNVGLFHPRAFQSRQPCSVAQLLCVTDASGVEFIDDSQAVHRHRLDDLLVGGELPVPD